MPRELRAETVWRLLPRRLPDTHKGSYGRLLCLAGSRAYRGAAALAAEGALRAGAGLVQLASVEEVLAGVWARLPECTLLPCREDGEGHISLASKEPLLEALGQATCFLAGPGLGKGEELGRLLPQLIGAARCPVVLDADALNLLAGHGPLPHPAGGQPLILTPHPGEMGRLCGLSAAQVNADRERIARDFALDQHCVVVLKGHRTLIAGPEGSLWQNTTGNPGLSRGGSGDILAGMTGALAAQGLPALHAALAAVWLHGAAADRCAARRSQLAMLPQDIFEDLGALLAQQGL